MIDTQLANHIFQQNIAVQNGKQSICLHFPLGFLYEKYNIYIVTTPVPRKLIAIRCVSRLW